MVPYQRERLLILDADGTIIDAFNAIEKSFVRNGMRIGELERFQKRRNLFKYLGGLKEFPNNLKQHIGKRKRSALIATLTEVYREEARLYEGFDRFVNCLIEQPDLRVGVVSRNITHKPRETLTRMFTRTGIDVDGLDFLIHLPLKKAKTDCFRKVRERYEINPARAYACGDERTDYEAASESGMHPFMVSYGFEDYDRLVKKLGIPPEVISRSPSELVWRVLHALDVTPPPPFVPQDGGEAPPPAPGAPDQGHA